MALDSRVKAGVATGGVATGFDAITNQRTPEQMQEWLEKMAEARSKRVLTNDVERGMNVMDVFIDPDSRSWEPEFWEATPAWRNWFGFDSLQRCVDFRPIDVAHRIEAPIAYFLAEKRTSLAARTAFATCMRPPKTPSQCTAMTVGPL